jgi:hypothetical protein
MLDADSWMFLARLAAGNYSLANLREFRLRFGAMQIMRYDGGDSMRDLDAEVNGEGLVFACQGNLEVVGDFDRYYDWGREEDEDQVSVSDFVDEVHVRLREIKRLLRKKVRFEKGNIKGDVEWSREYSILRHVNGRQFRVYYISRQL